MAFSVVLGGRGILSGLADDCNMLGPPDVLCEVDHQLHALDMSEVGLTPQATKKKINEQPSAIAV
jgi:hypothetical protein